MNHGLATEVGGHVTYLGVQERQQCTDVAMKLTKTFMWLKISRFKPSLVLLREHHWYCGKSTLEHVLYLREPWVQVTKWCHYASSGFIVFSINSILVLASTFIMHTFWPGHTLTLLMWAVVGLGTGALNFLGPSPTEMAANWLSIFCTSEARKC